MICDMPTPGIDIRPIRPWSHTTDFCEVFSTTCASRSTNVVGQMNDGWRVTMDALVRARHAFMADQVELAKVIEDLIEEARIRTGPTASDRSSTTTRSHAASPRAAAECAALRAMTIAGISRTRRTGMPGPEGSMIRLFHGELHQRVYRLGLDIIGADQFRLTEIDGEGVGRARTSSRSPTRSAAARPTSNGTSWASACLACPRVTE